MPPRFAYWTILVDNQPTSFRSSAVEDLLPTFNRLKAKNPSAVMMWFQGGKLWPSRLDAQEAMRARGDIGRKHDPNQSRPVVEGESPRKDGKLDWKPASAKAASRSEKPDWQPQSRRSGAAAKADWKPKSANAREEAKRTWKPKPYTPKADPEESSDLSRRSGDSSTEVRRTKVEAAKAEKPEWKPKGAFKPEASSRFRPEFKSKKDERPEWRAKSFNPKGKSKSEWKPKSDWKTKGSFKPDARLSRRSGEAAKGDGPRSPRPEARSPLEKPEWKPKGSFEPKPRRPRPDTGKKPAWKPKAEFKAESAKPDLSRRSGEAAKGDDKPEFRDRKKWRPGGEHQDPRQKYKDAKKAKWTRFKQTIRARSSRPKKRDS